jgi:hypothetical protein
LARSDPTAESLKALAKEFDSKAASLGAETAAANVDSISAIAQRLAGWRN